MVWIFYFTGAEGPHIATQSDLLVHPKPSAFGTGLRTFLLKTIINRFLNAKTLLWFKSFLS